ncbi:WD repeat and HMG-box DNA-binding protein 1 [Arapaima gigas]
MDSREADISEKRKKCDTRPKCIRSWSADSYVWSRRKGSSRSKAGAQHAEGDGAEDPLARSASCPRRRRERKCSCASLGEANAEPPCQKALSRRSLRQKFQEAVGQCFPIRTHHHCHHQSAASHPLSVLLWSKRKIHVSDLSQEKCHFSTKSELVRCWHLLKKNAAVAGGDTGHRGKGFPSSTSTSSPPFISWEEITCHGAQSSGNWDSPFLCEAQEPCSHTDYVLVPDLLQINNSPCYWGVLDRFKAEELLEGQPEGTFLLRDSAQDEFLFSVSFRRYSRSLHARIEHHGKRFSFDGSDPCVYRDPSVTGLLKHYSDPATCLFFEPLLSRPLPRNFPFSLQHLSRAVICSCTTYQGIEALPLPPALRDYLRQYHFKCDAACAQHACASFLGGKTELGLFLRLQEFRALESSAQRQCTEMPAERKALRYGHCEGHTDVCFDDTGRYIVTCGSDGDVRIWESLDDDDPKSINVGERAYSLALKNGKLVTAVSNNSVQLHTFPEGDPDGILTRFTTNANHVVFNSDGSRVAAGSSDFMVKIVEVSDSSQQKTLRGHQAPILSVAFDPQNEFLASSSCDGSVAVWKIDDQVQVVSWNLLQKSSDVSNAKSLCRLAWQTGLGKLLAVPVNKSVQLYERTSWSNVSNLSDDFITQPLNVVAWSPCGKFLAAGTIGGFLTVWDVDTKQCVERQKHEKGYTVCGISWHPSGGQIAYTDTEGCLGLLDGVAVSSSQSALKNSQVATGKRARNYDELFDEDDGGDLAEDLSENVLAANTVTGGGNEDDDDDDNPMRSTGRPRIRGAFLDDDDDASLDAGSVRNGDDNRAGTPLPSLPLPVSQHLYDGPMPTPPQKPFQPGSTPMHLMHRFMVWNSVGIVRGYNDEQDNAIDVEFHDTSLHHAMHLTNTLGHTMADMSQEAVLLACEGTDELASKIQCLHFSSWDTNKEWMVDLPKEEDARALCLGQGWAAVATSALLVRIFSIGGIQKEIFSLPGPVVCMAGHGEQLLIVYHRGTGFDGEQALGVQLLQFGQKKRQVIHGESLPLSSKSYLSWMGFTAEGTPCSVDSDGVVRMLNRSLGNTWTPVCNTRENCKGKCIPCKGSRFPPTLPRPAVAILPFKLPLCQTTTEKGHMEEQYWRSLLFQNHFDFLSSSGYETDEEARSRGQKEQQELLMKMFALSCKLEREFRCVELAELMTHSVVTLAIRYATRSHRMALAQRLGELALEKAAAQHEDDHEDDEEQSVYPSARQMSGYSESASDWKETLQPHCQQTQKEESAEEDFEEQDDQEKMDSGQVSEGSKPRLPLFNKANISPEETSLKPCGRDSRVNPFKVSQSKPAALSALPRATGVLDSMTASSRKPLSLGISGGKQSKEPILKPLVPRPKSKTQATLLQMNTQKTAKKNGEPATEQPRHKDTVSPATPPATTENSKPTTGFQLWLEENRKNILADKPDLDETDIIKEAMSQFRALSAEDRLCWAERAKGQSGGSADGRKRKRVEEGGEEKSSELDESSTKKTKTVEMSARLSAFAFNKNC